MAWNMESCGITGLYIISSVIPHHIYHMISHAIIPGDALNFWDR